MGIVVNTQFVEMLQENKHTHSSSKFYIINIFLTDTIFLPTHTTQFYRLQDKATNSGLISYF